MNVCLLLDVVNEYLKKKSAHSIWKIQILTQNNIFIHIFILSADKYVYFTMILSLYLCYICIYNKTEYLCICFWTQIVSHNCVCMIIRLYLYLLLLVLFHYLFLLSNILYISTHCIWHLILSTVIIIFLHSFVYYIVKCLFLESLVSSLLVDSFILFSVRFYLLVWTNGSSSKTNTRNIIW